MGCRWRYQSALDDVGLKDVVGQFVDEKVVQAKEICKTADGFVIDPVAIGVKGYFRVGCDAAVGGFGLVAESEVKGC